jgi:hypothetical protein
MNGANLSLKALAVLCAAILPPARGAFAQTGTEENIEAPEVRTRYATYKVVETESDGARKCVHRDDKVLFCWKADDAEFVRLEAPIITRAYTLAPIYSGALGSGQRWHTASLIIENGKRPRLRS